MDNLVIFDGRCGLCARSIGFILDHEAGAMLRFTPLQSPLGARLLAELGLDPGDAKTFVLIAGGKAHVKSDAAIEVSRFLRGGWKYLGAIRYVPRPIRDRAYDVVARNRYRWFGRLDACRVPSPGLRARFIEE